jgi:outer membrane protein insertion porin family
VVPEKFIHKELIPVIVSINSTTTPGVSDTTYRYVTSTTRYPGGRFFATYTVEQQFPVVHPLHAVVFFDAGNTWDQFHEIRPLDLKIGAGVGFRLEIPLLGNVGFDLGYGFNRDDGPRLKGHFLLGNVSF